MIYVVLAVAAYLVLGVVLTWSLLKGTTRRFRFRDAVLGAVFMPVLFVLLLLFELLEGVWERLLILLDFDPPEEMRAGPVESRGNTPESGDAP